MSSTSSIKSQSSLKSRISRGAAKLREALPTRFALQHHHHHEEHSVKKAAKKEPLAMPLNVLENIIEFAWWAPELTRSERISMMACFPLVSKDFFRHFMRVYSASSYIPTSSYWYKFLSFHRGESALVLPELRQYPAYYPCRRLGVALDAAEADADAWGTSSKKNLEVLLYTMKIGARSGEAMAPSSFPFLTSLRLEYHNVIYPSHDELAYLPSQITSLSIVYCLAESLSPLQWAMYDTDERPQVPEVARQGITMGQVRRLEVRGSGTLAAQALHAMCPNLEEFRSDAGVDYARRLRGYAKLQAGLVGQQTELQEDMQRRREARKEISKRSSLAVKICKLFGRSSS